MILQMELSISHESVFLCNHFGKNFFKFGRSMAEIWRFENVQKQMHYIYEFAVDKG